MTKDQQKFFKALRELLKGHEASISRNGPIDTMFMIRVGMDAFAMDFIGESTTTIYEVALRHHSIDSEVEDK